MPASSVAALGFSSHRNQHHRSTLHQTSKLSLHLTNHRHSCKNTNRSRITINQSKTSSFSNSNILDLSIFVVCLQYQWFFIWIQCMYQNPKQNAKTVTERERELLVCFESLESWRGYTLTSLYTSFEWLHLTHLAFMGLRIVGFIWWSDGCWRNWDGRWDWLGCQWWSVMSVVVTGDVCDKGFRHRPTGANGRELLGILFNLGS